MQIIDGRNDGYPCIPELPEITGYAVMTAPYPEFFMYLEGADVNGGYPTLRVLPDKHLFFSRSYTRNSGASELYFGEIPITAAYYGDAEVLIKY